MSQEDFDKFQRLVMQDLSLQKRLRAVTDRELFIERAIELSAECGYSITAEDLEEAMRQQRRAWLERWI